METTMRKLNVEEMELIAGAGDACCTKDCPPTKREHADNGWGNGADSTNAGSFSGGTAGSKSDNTWNGPGDGPGPDKFTTR
jgi:hypothetical protein